MSRPGTSPFEYLVTERYIHEAEQCGGFDLLPGAEKHGFRPGVLADYLKFAGHRSPDGTRPMQWHDNSPTWLYSPIFSATASVNAWLKTQDKQTFDRFVEKVFKPAVQNAMLALNAGCYGRKEVDGKATRVKADLVGYTAVHATAADGNCAVHAHPTFWRFVRAEDGQILSMFDRRAVYRMFAQALAVFHQSLAAGIEAEFGQRTVLKNGKCVMPDVPKEAIETTGTRIKAARQYLRDNDIGETEKSLQLAVWKTRPAVRQSYDLAERFAHWNEEVRQALGHKAAQYMKADATGKPKESIAQQAATEQKSEQKAEQKAGPEQAESGFEYFRQQPGKRRTASAEMKSRLLAWTVVATLAEIAKTAAVIARKAFVADKDVVRVKNPHAFIEQTRDRTVPEALRDVRRQLRKSNVDDWNAVLTLCRLTGAALKLYREARKPKVELRPGTVVMVSKKAQAAMGEPERKRLAELAAKNGWRVRYVGEAQRRQQQEEAERQQRRQRP